MIDDRSMVPESTIRKVVLEYHKWMTTGRWSSDNLLGSLKQLKNEYQIYHDLDEEFEFPEWME